MLETMLVGELHCRATAETCTDMLKHVTVAFKFRVPSSEENRSYTEFRVPRNALCR